MKPLLLTLLLLTSGAQAEPWLVNGRPRVRTSTSHTFNAGQTFALENNGGSWIRFSELAPTTQGKKYNPPGVPKLPRVPKVPSSPKVPSLPKVPRVPKVPR